VRLEAEVQLVKAEGEKPKPNESAWRPRSCSSDSKSAPSVTAHGEPRSTRGGVAHDFNNLLAVILNYASFVNEELSSAVVDTDGTKWEGSLNDVKQIQLAAERASVLTHQLLAFARREVIQAVRSVSMAPCAASKRYFAAPSVNRSN